MSAEEHKEELKKVLAKANDCLADAEYLYEGKRYEAAINRAYYAMFTAVQGLLLSYDIFVKTHSGAKNKFHELYLKTGLLPIELGKILEDASILRQEAGYDFAFHVSEEDAKQTIDDAVVFIKSVALFLK